MGGSAGVKDNWRQHVRHRSGSRHVYSLGVSPWVLSSSRGVGSVVF
ncbi:hypothetical protein M5D96_002696 [Drosophila gunungcola]|uniref:Uncharacterized protein n=1 Tax=Drosophila gunungcola TaxID=103775 RepID=A0A9P9Z0H9_9MUSC|nr:hypothetical protein M5D96_002696 [Drosophila gunungcola]